jgi:hypothetical protein
MFREMGPVTTMASAWRGEATKLMPKAGQVEKRGGQHVQIGLAGVAPGGRYLAQLKRAAEQFLEVLPGMCGQSGKDPSVIRCSFSARRFQNPG